MSGKGGVFGDGFGVRFTSNSGHSVRVGSDPYGSHMSGAYTTPNNALTAGGYVRTDGSGGGVSATIRHGKNGDCAIL